MEDLSKYSDEELKSKTNRNRVERQYLDSVSSRNRKPESLGKKIVTGVLTTASTALVADVIKNKENSLIGRAVVRSHKKVTAPKPIVVKGFVG